MAQSAIIRSDVEPLNKNNERSIIRLKWFGHSCFRMEINKTCLFFDPVRKNNLLGTTLEPQKEKYVTAIFVSHDHWDHYDAETIIALCSADTEIFCPTSVANSLLHRMTFEVSNIQELNKLKEKVVTLKKEDIIKINELQIICLEASEGLSFLIVDYDKKLLFMGDSVATKDMIEQKSNVILFPVWSVKGEEARTEDFLALAEGKLCIPMHYQTTPNALPNFYVDIKEIMELLPQVNIKVLEKNRTYHI